MRASVLLLAVTILTLPLAARTLEEANALEAAGKHEAAIEVYRAIVAEDDRAGAAWYGLGRSLQALGNFDEALAAFDRAGEAGFQPGGVLFRKGTLYIELGRLDLAREWLHRAASNGVPVHRLARGFPAFEKVRDDEAFAEFMTSLAPCSSPQHRQFDFWIGDWDVYDPSGQLVGTNTIESILEGCVIHESWTGASGSAGRSFNRWDREGETWNQHWVTDSGTEMILSGTFDEGRMVLETLPGVSPRQRWTWYEIEPGKVRQRADQTEDGETWSVVWDSVYIPQGEAWEPVELE